MEGAMIYEKVVRDGELTVLRHRVLPDGTVRTVVWTVPSEDPEVRQEALRTFRGEEYREEPPKASRRPLWPPRRAGIRKTG